MDTIISANEMILQMIKEIPVDKEMNGSELAGLLKEVQESVKENASNV